MAVRCLPLDRRHFLLLTAAALAACSAGIPVPPGGCPSRATADGLVYVVARGWHVEIGLAADQLCGDLGVYRDIFPGARFLMFGYGKRTFFTAPTDSISEYMLGPIPGRAAIQVTGLAVSPLDAYPPGATDILALPREGARVLSAYIADDLARDRFGGPQLLGPGPFPGSLFYGARSRYSLAHTCNTWVAAGLQKAGLPVRDDGVVFSGQVVARVAAARTAQCLGST